MKMIMMRRRTSSIRKETGWCRAMKRRKRVLRKKLRSKSKRATILKILRLRNKSRFLKNLTILKTYPHFRVFTAVSTILGAWFSAGARTAINGSVTERVRTTTGAIFSGTWSKPTTKKFRCIMSPLSRTPRSSATFVGQRTCFCWVLFLPKHKHALFFFAGSHV